MQSCNYNNRCCQLRTKSSIHLFNCHNFETSQYCGSEIFWARM